MNNRKVKHHYVPRLYLEGFCDENEMLWTYKKAAPKTPYSQKPENVAFENYFYSLEGDGVEPDAFEDALADIVEGPAAAPLRSLRARMLPTFDDRQRLSVYFGFMLVRTPSYKRHSDRQINRELNTRFKLAYGDISKSQNEPDEETSGENVEQLKEGLFNGKYNVELAKNYSLSFLQKLGFAMSESLASMNWTIITISEDNVYFLTSDKPIIIENLNKQGFYSSGLATLGVKIYIPVSKNTCLLMERESTEILSIKVVSANASLVGDINKLVILNSEKYVYACENSKTIKKLIYDNRKNS